MYDWNDLKAFLAVAETGSTLSAAQALRVSQTTVARRIAALEAATSLNLFERRQAGYALTPVGEAMLASAIAVRDAANRFGEAAGARSRSEEHTSELQSLMRISYAVFCLKKKNNYKQRRQHSTYHITLRQLNQQV